MSANATDPLMVPASVTMESYLELTVHFLVNNLNTKERPNIAITLDIMHINNYSPRKLRDMTYVVR